VCWYEPVLKRARFPLKERASCVIRLSCIGGLGGPVDAFECRAPGSGKFGFGGLSLFCFAWSTLARLGKPGISWGSETVIERLDSFRFVYWLGIFAGTFALI
jgi:hypothetical protein